ncbi:MAG: ATP-dependent 6-phosphofructokinase [Pirellulaceae bacterium]|nr:ATP-dependent 6-phosphofructokinase [Pirellulaceae bacterium]
MHDPETADGESSGTTIGVLTGGGDCPGLNAAIRAVVRRGMTYDWHVVGFRNGWAGVIDRDYVQLESRSVSGILQQGGTMLGTSRTDPRKSPESYAKVESVFDDLQLEAIVAIGGDDTLSVANALAKDGRPVVGIPKTMDNDVQGTDYCIGFDSAVTRVMEALDYLHTTATSHHRAMVLEVMGRDAGWVAAIGGLAGGADFIIVPETTVHISSLVAHLERRRASGRDFSIIVVAEGATIDGLASIDPVEDTRDEFGHKRLEKKQIGQRLTDAIESKSGMETRVTVLGHVQRGGPPSVFDRVLATRLGVTAVDMVKDKRWGFMSALQGSAIVRVSLDEAVASNRKLDLELYKVAEIFF